MSFTVEDNLFTLTSAQRIASHVSVFRGARFSSLPTNACLTEDKIPSLFFYLRGK